MAVGSETQMKGMRPTSIFVAILVTGLVATGRVLAAGVPIAGFSPLVGLTLTDRFKPSAGHETDFFISQLESSLVGTQFGQGAPFYEIALFDIGAGVSLLSTAADASFDIEAAGFRGEYDQALVGATGTLNTTINDPMAMFAIGLGHRSNGPQLTFNAQNTTFFKGQSSISVVTPKLESSLPSIIGMPFASQYTTYIHSDQPQIFSSNGRTVRAPHIEFLPLGSGGQGITRRAPMQLVSRTGAAFISSPAYVFNFETFPFGPDNPQLPTHMDGGAAIFLNVNASNDGTTLTGKELFFDTGADVTVLSTLTASQLGFNVGVTEPDFTIDVSGAVGTAEGVPGFFLDELTILSVGAPQPYKLTNVPIIVLDLPDPTDPVNFVDGIIGTNILAGRNLVIDPKPAFQGGTPSLYIGEPVTINHNWSTTNASGNWATGTNWTSTGTPETLWIATAANVSGTPQEAVVSSNSTVWELNVAGVGAATMTVRVQAGARLTTFSGANLAGGGRIQLENGTLDVHFIDIRGGTLTGSGTVLTGSGPIPGQVENFSGTVAPGNSIGTLTIIGRYSNGRDGTLAIELGGLAPGTGHDQLVVEGTAALGGTLAVSLANLGGGTYAPNVGDEFAVIVAENVNGEFGHLAAPPNYNLRAEYEEDRVRVVVGIQGDYNDDGTVNAADYTVWRNSLGSTTNTDADGDGSGTIGAGDFTVWKNHYGDVDPFFGAAMGAGSVPEPASIALLLLAAVFFGMKRPRR
ncbi:MAG: aspartyl protease family protein [Pirellulales bacterium]